MTDATLSYARALRRHAEACARVRVPITITIDPISAAHLADIIERGCHRSDYVRKVQVEAERLRDLAEDELLRAQDLNAAADRALNRVKSLERFMQIGGLVVAGIILVAAGWL